MEYAVQAVGVLTLVLSVAIKVIGEADQIRKNQRRASTEGISRPLYVLGFASYCAWTAYGILLGDWVIIGAQGLGVITSFIILAQMRRFRGDS